jgi:hypothetical protein
VALNTYLFICGLFNDAVSSSNYIFYGVNQWTVNIMEGSDRGRLLSGHLRGESEETLGKPQSRFESGNFECDFVDNVCPSRPKFARHTHNLKVSSVS